MYEEYSYAREIRSATSNKGKQMNSNSIGVIGGGLMGCGITTRCALAGFATVLIESDATRLEQIALTIDAILSELIDAGSIDAEQRHLIHHSMTIATSIYAVQHASVVIEAIPEVLLQKQILFSELESILSPDALILSNTSGFLPDALAEKMTHKERCLVAHFWNPPHLIPLVEVVPGTATLPAATKQTVDLMHRIGSEPVVLQKAIPGFVGNRLQFALLREALHIVHSGAADAATVDAVMTASLGRRYSIMGPLESADLGGLQTLLKVGTYLLPELSSDLQSLELLRDHVARAELGSAAGQGFYRWDADRLASIRQRRLRHLRHNNKDGIDSNYDSSSDSSNVTP
jgi:3-hydroxybutyryl-CoA dehydrogenase